MSELLRTDVVATDEQLAYWGELASRAFVPLRVEPVDYQHGLSAVIHSASLGTIQACVIDADGHRVHRPQRLAASGAEDYYKLSLQLRGSAVLDQDGRTAVLEPGDFALYDCTRPYSLTFGDTFRMFVLLVPRGRLPLSPETTSSVTAVRMPGHTGANAVISGFLLNLTEHMDGLRTDTLARLAGTVLDLLATGFEEQPNMPVHNVDSSHAAVLWRVKAFIERRLDDIELAPMFIAAAHGMSVRYLHRLFESDSHTVSGYIRQRRLEQCRRELAHPSLRDRPISDVAARWGLADPAQFSKQFKAAFGCSPRDYRLGTHPLDRHQ